jgi:hypothetical protein
LTHYCLPSRHRAIADALARMIMDSLAGADAGEGQADEDERS